MKKKNIIASTIGSLIKDAWSLFLSGLFTILPITLTIAVFNFSFKLVKGWVQPVQHYMPDCLIRIPHSEILLVIIFIFVMGIIMQVFILRSVVHSLEKIIFKLPLIRPIYSGIKQLVDAFSPQDTNSFKHVVLVEFPRVGTYSVGFVTSEVPHELSPTKTDQEGFVCVFIPTTPNPTTGFFIFLPHKDVTIVDLTRQEAMALIISGGIIQPNRFIKR
jgi:uncharacterized membrane protein